MRVLVGAGGMAIDWLTYNSPAYCVSLIDEEKKGNVLGHPIIGTISEFLHNHHLMPSPKVYNCIGSVGNNTTRNSIYRLFKENGIYMQNVILSAFVAQDVQFGANVCTNVGSQIHHGCNIGNNVVISPAVTICGDCCIDDNVFIGAGATIIQGIYIGKNSVIAAGAVVTRDISSNQLYGGVPAKSLR